MTELPARLARSASCSTQVGEHRFEVTRPEREVDTVGADARSLDHVFDHAAESSHLSGERVASLQVVGVRAAPGPAQHVVGHQLHGCEWRAQLVRDEDEEVVACSNGLLRRAVEARVLQRGRNAPADLLGERAVTAVVTPPRNEETHRADRLPGGSERDADTGRDAELLERRAFRSDVKGIEHGGGERGQEQRLFLPAHHLREGGGLGETVDERLLPRIGMNRPDALERPVGVQRPDERDVRELGHRPIQGAAHDLARVERGKGDARKVVQESRATDRDFGAGMRARLEGGRDDLARTHGKLLFRPAPLPPRSDMLVAQDSAELALHPYGDVEHRGDPATRAVVPQAASARIAEDVFDIQHARFPERLEVVGNPRRLQGGAVLERSAAGDETRVAAQARSMLMEAPEAHALDMDDLRLELANVSDLRPPVSAPAARELEHQARGLGSELHRRGGWGSGSSPLASL